MAPAVTASYRNTTGGEKEFVLTSAEVADIKGLVGALVAMQKDLNTKLTTLLEAEKAAKAKGVATDGSDHAESQRKRQKSE